jgi:fermentation-respiration switch protein FrsA (DUF1100 family)
VILYGQSLGCAVACHVSNNHRAAALILQSGFASLRHVAFEHFPLLRGAPALVPNALDNEEILSHSNLPVLLIHGDKDKVVPFDNAEDLYKSATGSKRLVVCPNAGHNLYPEAVDLHRQAVHEFIREVTAGNSAADSADISGVEDKPPMPLSAAAAVPPAQAL